MGLILLEVIKWLDNQVNKLAHRIPEQGSGEIKWGAQLIVRESQAVVFFSWDKGYLYHL